MPKASFRYDALGRVESEIDELGNTLLYAFDAAGCLTETYLDQNGNGEIDAGTDQHLLSYAWRGDGKLQSKTDRLTSETTTDSYYPLPIAPATDPKAGRLMSAANPAASYSFDYFANGWLKRVDDGTTQVEYLYDAAGRRELATVRQGATTLQSLDYVYDAATKELKEIVSLAGTFGFTYDAWGRRSSLSYPNGVGATYSYDLDMDWLTGIDYAQIGLSLGYPLHDRVGNRKQRLEDGVATDYAYDATYQLTQAKTGESEENFVYDAVGNRRAGPTVKEALDATYLHDDANRMLEGRKFAYAYDNRGNRIRTFLSADQSKRWEFTWDGENKLTEAKLVDGVSTLRTVSFAYDPFGRRVQKVVSGLAPQVPVPLTTRYVYDGEDIVLQTESDGTATTVTQYVHGPGIDESLAMVTGGQAFYYHADGLGSIVAISDSTQNVVARYGYESFGMVAASDPEFANAYAYTGREWDREIGLYYYRARYYDPMEGRFISKDPIGFAAGDVNVYRYVFNGSSNMADPSGLLVYIQVNRVSYGPDEIRGQITASSSVTGDRIFGYTLERGGASGYGHTDEGVYSGLVQNASYENPKNTYDPARVRIEKSNVAGAQIHNGADIDSSHGCTLAGNRLSNGGVFSGSKDFMRNLINMIKEDGGDIRINIINAVPYRPNTMLP